MPYDDNALVTMQKNLESCSNKVRIMRRDIDNYLALISEIKDVIVKPEIRKMLPKRDAQNQIMLNEDGTVMYEEVIIPEERDVPVNRRTEQKFTVEEREQLFTHIMTKAQALYTKIETFGI